MLSIHDLNVRYGEKIIYKNANVDIPSKGINFLLGKNGAGKTTLIKCLLNHMDYKGEIKLNGRSYQHDRKEVFAVFDDSALYKQLSGLQNIMLITGKKKQEVLGYAQELLHPKLLNKKVSTYSYGEKKKIFLVIADVLRPRLLLMDEVSNGLDYETMLLLKKKVRAWSGESMILMTGHQFEFYKDIVERVFVVQDQTIKAVEMGQRSLEEIYEETIR